MTTAYAEAGWRFRQPSVIPGFGLTLGFSLAYLTLIILIPLTALVWRSAALGWNDFFAIATDRRTLKALQISFGTAFIAAAVNVVFGTIVAWVLVRYRFPGRRIVDAMVDLPFALPTAVAGIALTTLYAPKGWLGSLLDPLGIKVAYTPLGIIIALIFIGLPFVVRTVQPIMEEIDKEVEEVAATLGANRLQTVIAGAVSGPGAGDRHRLRTGLRARRRRIRLGHLHCRQFALRVGNRAAFDRHPARGIRLRRSDRDRRDHARPVVRDAPDDQPGAVVEPQALWLIQPCLSYDRAARQLYRRR